ncbi:hypothetical protein HCN_1061 [Helicobacter cinaedi PAGU611]|uniref:hypothetical protein n=1 Tax=Helicobacter cinaedi TaxID=213 RepID=UPI00025D33E5|nr:hypothetical protein [Helicobacter cinaedi]AWK61864.1 hypothetical protein C6B36_05480 [Helicobacter cinaedi]QOQ95966.1 hypothetical protein HW245_10340 [Helicobacter cinaedi]BAM12289.1 hypothetical protein HCN_1061 [Helicobacter cinaedi PAGU611]
MSDFRKSTNLESSNSKIVSEKTRQSRSFFSKCGAQENHKVTLKGNDRRDFSQLPHLSPQAELPKHKNTKLSPE